tara:strand:+ start:169 stop:552 length:384 start_codon:yes stop_codon:yes gene_type:complete
MINKNTLTKVMAYLNKDNYGYKGLNPVQADYIRTHVPDKVDIACIINANICDADCGTIKGKAGAINIVLQTVRLLRKNSNFTGLREIDLLAYAWFILTDMSMYGYIHTNNEYISYAVPFPFTGTVLN